VTRRCIGALPLAALAVAVLLGCSRSAPDGAVPHEGSSSVTDVVLGRELAADSTIVPESRTNLFWTTDKFCVAVAVDGSEPSAQLKARWKYQDGTQVAEDTKTVPVNGPTVVAFEAAPPDGRWKAGDYNVEILLDGVSAATKELNAR